jgi:hypothetical protein
MLTYAAVAVQRAALRIVEEALGNRLHFARVVSREAVEAPLAAAGIRAYADVCTRMLT